MELIKGLLLAIAAFISGLLANYIFDGDKVKGIILLVFVMITRFVLLEASKNKN